MTSERDPKLQKLIDRMPKDIREEVKRLDAEVEQLKKKVEKRFDEHSPVGYMEYNPKHAENKQPYERLVPLPADKAVRFYDKKYTTRQQQVHAGGYLDVLHDRNQKQDEKGLIIEIRADFGGLIIHPVASNLVYIQSKKR